MAHDHHRLNNQIKIGILRAGAGEYESGIWRGRRRNRVVTVAIQPGQAHWIVRLADGFLPDVLVTEILAERLAAQRVRRVFDTARDELAAEMDRIVVLMWLNGF